MKKERVLLLGKIPPPYMGPAIATAILLNSGLKDRFELIHLDTRINRSLEDMGKWSLAKVFRNIFIYARMKIILLTRWPKLVVIPISQSNTGFIKDFFFIFIARLFFRKILLHLRGSELRNWIDSNNPVMKRFIIYTLRLSNGVIVLGNNLKYLFEGIFPEKQVYVAPNGGNYSFKKSVKTEDKVRILYLANLQATKGIEDLLEALVIVAGEVNEGFVADVVGSWRSENTKTKCMEIVSVNNLPVNFHPSAAGEEKLNYFSNADLFVFTPRSPEGHPWVIVESMAAGLPIISTDKGAIRESVIDGQNGYIVEAGNTREIASRILELIKDKSRREEMGMKSRKFYEEKFTEEKMVENLTSIFHKVISEA